MAAELSKTKRRIASIEATEKTTKAMGLIAMVKLRRLFSSFENSNLYSEEFEDTMSHLLFYDKKPYSKYSSSNEKAKSDLYLVVTSDLGLCGAYNSSICKFIEPIIQEDDVLGVFGKKGTNHFEAISLRNLDLSYAGFDILDDLSLDSLAKRLKDEFDTAKFRSIKIIYTHYINSLRSEPKQFTLLPIEKNIKEWENEKTIVPEFDGKTKEIIDSILLLYLKSQIQAKFIESALSEQSNRRNAMDNANDNADELLEKLRIEYNKARQSAITQEITEVVGGASANE